MLKRDHNSSICGPGKTTSGSLFAVFATIEILNDRIRLQSHRMRSARSLGSTSVTSAVEVENSLSRLDISGNASIQNGNNGLEQHYIPASDIPLTYGDRGSSLSDEHFSKFQTFPTSGMQLNTYQEPSSVLNRFVN